MYGLHKDVIKIFNDFTGFKTKSDGFALLEVVIALIIFGIISGMSLSILKNYNQQSKESISKQNIQEVNTALIRYVKRFKKLPCPSHLNQNNGHFGFAISNCQSAADSIGIIPYKTLGIPERTARDGYDKFLTYVVDPDLTIDTTIGAKSTKNENNLPNAPVDGFGDDDFYGSEEDLNNKAEQYPGKIRINDQHEIGVIDYNQDKIAYLIIQNISNNFDDDMHNLSNQERINTQKSWVFYDLPYSENKNHLFRQRLSWVSLHTLIDKIQRIF